jgi:hypothetical protein
MPLPPPPPASALKGVAVHPFCERLLPDTAESFEGHEDAPPMVLPVEVSLVPDAVETVGDACVALQRLVEVCCTPCRATAARRRCAKLCSARP